MNNLTAGHVFAFGESRALAIANMVLGLKEIQIRGEIRTNVDYTIDLLHVSFLFFDDLCYPGNHNLLFQFIFAACTS